MVLKTFIEATFEMVGQSSQRNFEVYKLKSKIQIHNRLESWLYTHFCNLQLNDMRQWNKLIRYYTGRWYSILARCILLMKLCLLIANIQYKK